MYMKNDSYYMQLALKEAVKAAERDEIPVGALVVSPYGEVLGKGRNAVEKNQCQEAHAEIRAIRQATKKIKDWRLTGCTLYVTLEPCMMCVSLIALSRISRIVYGAKSPLFGYHLDKEGVLALYTRQIKSITSGVRAEESARLLRDFFKKKRERSE
jgi:tRNA(adenine34) deaminase